MDVYQRTVVPGLLSRSDSLASRASVSLRYAAANSVMTVLKQEKIMIKGAVGFVAIFVAFGICCMELKIQYDRYVYAVPDSWMKDIPERYRKDGVITYKDINVWQDQKNRDRFE